jgi:hypothetical protein
MPAATFVKDNPVLVVGLSLPVLLMAGFLVAGALPGRLADPPRYDAVFTVQDWRSPGNSPVTARLVVRGGALHVQYTKGGGAGWKRLFLYDAATRTSRELPFDVPADAGAIDTMREDAVASAAGLTIDPMAIAPDGYEFVSSDDRGGGGLLTEIFGGRRGVEPRLRKNGTSVPVAHAPGQPPFAYGAVEFVGWVTGRS